MDEKRRLERFDLEVPATIQPRGADREEELFNLQTSNICSGGVFFYTNQPLAEGMQVKIDLILPLDKLNNLKDGAKKVFINVTGRVLRSDPKGMAICFDEDYEIHQYNNDNETKH